VFLGNLIIYHVKVKSFSLTRVE